jgi:hypothetical protein
MYACQAYTGPITRTSSSLEYPRCISCENLNINFFLLLGTKMPFYADKAIILI